MPRCALLRSRGQLRRSGYPKLLVSLTEPSDEQSRADYIALRPRGISILSIGSRPRNLGLLSCYREKGTRTCKAQVELPWDSGAQGVTM